ncbi:MAG: hypothetical protein ACM3YM_03360 [Sphingomonadales bacterium]
MAYSTTVPALAALSLLGAGAGVQLGRSAIGEINPVYFHDRLPPRSFADLAPGGYRPDAAATAVSEPADFWANEAGVGGLPLCDHCGANFVDPVYAAAPGRAVTPAGAEPQAGAIAQARPLWPDKIDRYANFPVTQEEAQAQANRRAHPDYTSQAAGQLAATEAEEAQPTGM